MSKRPLPSLEDTGIPRARKGEAAPAVEHPPEEKAPLPMFLRPGAKRYDVAQQDATAATPTMVPAGAGEGPVVTESHASPGPTPPPAPTATAIIDAKPAGRASMRLVPRKAQSRGEPRSPVTTRLTYELQDRLFAAATQLGQTQQQIIEDALDAHLAGLGL